MIELHSPRLQGRSAVINLRRLRPLRAYLIPFPRVPSVPRLHCGFHHAFWSHNVACPHDGWDSLSSSSPLGNSLKQEAPIQTGDGPS